MDETEAGKGNIYINNKVDLKQLYTKRVDELYTLRNTIARRMHDVTSAEEACVLQSRLDHADDVIHTLAANRLVKDVVVEKSSSSSLGFGVQALWRGSGRGSGSGSGSGSGCGCRVIKVELGGAADIAGQSITHYTSHYDVAPSGFEMCFCCFAIFIGSVPGVPTKTRLESRFRHNDV